MRGRRGAEEGTETAEDGLKRTPRGRTSAHEGGMGVSSDRRGAEEGPERGRREAEERPKRGRRGAEENRKGAEEEIKIE